MTTAWFPLSLLAFVLFSAMSTLLAHAIRGGLPTHFVLLILGFGFVIAYGIQTVVRPPELSHISLPVVLGLIAATVCSVVANWAMFQATASAPNPGIPIAIGGGQAVGVAIIAALLFGDKLTWTQSAGIALSVLGAALMSLGRS